ncbi:MAG: cysteine--tRNA ligase [Candidatus Caldatribacteriota bacterium]
MSLKLYNTLSQKKEEFIPLKKGEVKMYICGPTVYNFIHIGNARPFVIFETLKRYLEYKGYKVKWVQNFTDIDDKMINNAQKLKITVAELAEKFIQEYFVDADFLNLQRAEVHPRATEHITEIIALIKELERKGYAYNIEGDVFFEVPKFKDYGKLSGQNIDELKEGARIEVDLRKKNAIDFALWKKSKPGEPFWPSPWGEGRPGWHIECSAMSMKYLGETIDIHAGGSDLIFPHHENEIAQSEAATGQPFVRYWLHNGYIFLDNQKMSKSLGNIMKVRELSKRFRGEAVRYFILSAHYRSPLNFSEEQLQQAEASVQRIENVILNLEHSLKQGKIKDVLENQEKQILEQKNESAKQLIIALDDDFNTPVAISHLFNFARIINSYLASNEWKSKLVLEESKNFYYTFAGQVLGILKEKEKITDLDLEIEELLKEREQARKKKNWKKSDQIREELKRKGVILEDTPEGVRLRRVN